MMRRAVPALRDFATEWYQYVAVARYMEDATGTLTRAHATRIDGDKIWVAWACDSMPVATV